HTIKVDNPGTDWISIASYVFTNIGSPLNVYVLRSADKTKAAGWMHNKDHNYQYLLDHSSMLPPPVNGATLHMPGMANGSYEVIFFNCYSGMAEDTVIATASDDTLRIALPSVNR